MKIFFTVPFNGKHLYQKQYDLVLDALEQQSVEVISPEKGNYHSVLSHAEIKKIVDPQVLHYHAIRKGIELADAVIFEVSHEDFQVGFETAYALETKKYVLALSQCEDFSKKIKHPYFRGAKYTEYTIDNTVESFLHFVAQHEFSERFNFFLSPGQLQFVREQSEKEGLNQSEYVRKLIDEERFK